MVSYLKVNGINYFHVSLHRYPFADADWILFTLTDIPLGSKRIVVHERKNLCHPTGVLPSYNAGEMARIFWQHHRAGWSINLPEEIVNSLEKCEEDSRPVHLPRLIE
jgi:hypothetical protein